MKYGIDFKFLLQLCAVFLISAVFTFSISHLVKRDARLPECPCCCLRSATAHDRP